MLSCVLDLAVFAGSSLASSRPELVGEHDALIAVDDKCAAVV